MIALRFSETMAGYVAIGQQDFQRGYDEGRRSNTPMSMRLTLTAPDLDAFLRSNTRTLDVSGVISCPPFGQEMAATGTVEQLVAIAGDPRRGESMPYRLQFAADDGRRLMLAARKTVDAELDAWQETTTLYTHVIDAVASDVIAAGILHISFLQFLGQFPTYKLTGGSPLRRLLAFPRFYGSFLGRLWQVYGPRLGGRR